MSDAPSFDCLTYRRADNGVAFIAIDVPDRPVNVLTPELHKAIGEVAEHLAEDESAVGAVIHSGKSSFMAGGDLKRIVRIYDQGLTPAEAYSGNRTYSKSLRKLETCGKPVAVAVNGNALGGGLELALAGHHRVVVDDSKVMLGLPEVTLGLLPGGGGTQRLPRLIGLKQAADLILSGRRIDPTTALELGIVDQVAAADELLGAAEQWVLNGAEAEQPWDRKGFRVPGGAGLNDMRIGRLFQQLTAKVNAEYRHNYPAPIAALRALFNGSTVSSMDAALKIETREFASLVSDPVARNMIRTRFLNRGKLSRKDIMAIDNAELLRERCLDAYRREAQALLSGGVQRAVIENAAWAVGMSESPLGDQDDESANSPNGSSSANAGAVGQRLLCCQTLAAVECWEQGLIEPVQADLVSVFGWDFPGYTGGVLSYADTLGLGRFIALCEELNNGGSKLEPSDWLRGRAAENDRIYPSTA